MSTLPLHRYEEEWQSARQLHSKRFSRSIWSILDCAMNCRHDNTLEVCQEWFFKKTAKKNTKKEIVLDKELFDAVRSWEGRSYLRKIQQGVVIDDINKDILTASAERLLDFLGEILDIYGKDYYDQKGVIYLCNRYLLKVFNYEAFIDNGFVKCDDDKLAWGVDKKKKPVWGGAELLKKSGLRYCPYCNAESVYAIPKDLGKPEDKATKSAFDHIIPHDKYPFFGISLYNLIPSCFRCNSGYKSTHNPLGWLNKGKDGKANDPISRAEIDKYRLVHPYIENIHDSYQMRIRFADDSKDYSVVGEDSKLEVKCDFDENLDDGKERYEGLIEDIFHMSKTYSCLFTPDVKVFLRRLKILRPAVLNGKLWKFLGLNNRSVNTLLYGENIDEFLIPRHGKLHSDLCKQFNVK